MGPFLLKKFWFLVGPWPNLPRPWAGPGYSYERETISDVPTFCMLSLIHRIGNASEVHLAHSRTTYLWSISFRIFHSCSSHMVQTNLRPSPPSNTGSQNSNINKITNHLAFFSSPIFQILPLRNKSWACKKSYVLILLAENCYEEKTLPWDWNQVEQGVWFSW